jgi:hypothetical protein
MTIRATAVLAVLCAGISCRGPEPPAPPTSAPQAELTSPLAAPSRPADPPPATRPASPLEQRDETVYDAPFDAANRLIITTTYTSHVGSCCSTVLRVQLVDRTHATRLWEVDSISEQYEYDYTATRIEPSSLVLCRTESHGYDEGCFKFFIDPTARRLVRVAFDLAQDVVFADDAEARRRLGVSAQDLNRLKTSGVFRTTAVAADPPPAFTAHRLPQSTYADFARARPGRVANGYREDGTKIAEKIGASQAQDGGFWFGKTFYDGEGTTGVGGIGFLNANGQYRWLTIADLSAWSVDAMLVEPDAIWAGLVNHGEGPDHSGGLLRYDRAAKTADVHNVPGVILRIVHVGDAVFLGTMRGLFVLRDDTITWHHMEPDISGRMVVITETVK